MRCLIVIPTYNRAGSLAPAIDAALSQSHAHTAVAVIDDGSDDETPAVCARYADHPRFVAIRLAQNVGTARAKNVALALLPFDAVTFHDSDDLPDRDKLLRQARTLARGDLVADPCLPWAADTQWPGDQAALDLVVTGHRHITADGSSETLCRPLSLVDDFFPNLQFNTGALGDWVLINSGLFRREALVRAGGFADLVEEDREIRNRLIMHGRNIWLIPAPLLTKFESADSLTARADTGYHSALRANDRATVWDRIARWRKTGEAPVELIDLADIEIDAVSAPARLRLAEDLPMTVRTRARLTDQLERLLARPRVAEPA